MTDNEIALVVILLFLFVGNIVFSLFEASKLEKQYKRHKEAIVCLFDDFRGMLYNDIVNYFDR